MAAEYVSIEERKQQMEKRRKLLIDQKSPSTKNQSTSFVEWGGILDQIGADPFSNDRLTFRQLDQMRRDPIIAFCLHFTKMPLIRASWYVNCPERPDIASCVDGSLRRIWGKLVMQFLNSLDYGFAPTVKRFELIQPDWRYRDAEEADPNEQYKLAWDYGRIKMTSWADPVPLVPQKSWPAWTPEGEFAGIKYSGVSRGLADIATEFVMEGDTLGQYIDVSHALWFTNERDSEFGRIYGFPRTAYAFKYWWSYWYNWALADRAFEKKADAPIVVYHPEDVTVDEQTNEVMDFADKALNMAEAIRSGSNVALPATLLRDPVNDTATSLREWSIEEMKIGANLDVFNERFEYLDRMKMRALFTPEQAFVDGRGGSSSRNVADTLGDTFSESQIVALTQICDHVTSYMLPDFLKANFPGFEGTCTIVPRGLSDKDVALSRQILGWFGQKDPASLGVDTRTLLDDAGIPLKTPKEMQREAEEEIKKAQAMQPPQVEGGRGETAIQPGEQSPPSMEQMDAGNYSNGTSEDSKDPYAMNYVSTGSVLHLSDSRKWHPNTPHFDDPEVRSEAEQLRAFFRTWYGEMYEDAAKHIEGLAELGLSDQEPAIALTKGCMVALKPSAELAAKLAVPGGVPPDKLHITLAYLGKDFHYHGVVQRIVEEWAATTHPIHAIISGIGYFDNSADGGDRVTYASVDSDGMQKKRAELFSRLKWAGLNPSEKHGFTPHITLLDSEIRPTLALPADINGESGPELSFSGHYFDTVVIAYDDIAQEFPLNVDAPVHAIDLADDDRARRDAERIVSTWRAGLDRVQSVSSRALDALFKILGRGAVLELERANIADTVQWNMDAPEARGWAEKRGADLVKNVTETVRDELRTFLADEMKEDKGPKEIAAAVREHFSQWPGWKAERLARTETATSYNAATILAAEQAGLNLQALDAAVPENSDPDCIARDGKIMTPREAWAALSEEHPNGTLGFAILPQELRLERHDEMPSESPPGAAAWYDSDSSVIHASLELSDEQVNRYCKRVVEELR